MTMPSRNAMVRSLVPASDVLNAVALNSMQQQSSRIVWPSLAGGMITFLGIGPTILLIAGLSLVGMVCLKMIAPIREEAVPARASAYRMGAREDAVVMRLTLPHLHARE